jgi:fructan beta-fructosidase
MVAVTADEKRAVFLDSHDLKTWSLTGSFEAGSKEKGQWECPDLFELAVDGDPKNKKWVLIVNRNPGAPAGGTGVEYFVGQFDGASFHDEGSPGQGLWADRGKDFYATNSFSDIPVEDGRRIWMGWMGNWQYANREPTEIWRGAQSLPRVLRLTKFEDGIRLLQSPVAETKSLRRREMLRVSNVPVNEARQSLQQASVSGETLEIDAELAPGAAKELGFRLRKGASEETLLGFVAETGEVFIDRTRSGATSFSPDFPGRHKALLSKNSKVKVQIFLDRSSLEVFVNDGEVVLTDRIYPSPQSNGLELYSEGEGARAMSLVVWKLGSAWQ